MSTVELLKNASFVRIILMLLFLPFKATEWVGEKSITLDKNEEKVVAQLGLLKKVSLPNYW